uniref:Complement C1q tumor necrosis factor-related protein 4 n=1 Tax=Sinocyclocheilus anshuiensis TaxID=1608454 RepID=A0A671KXI6_9TELE
QTPLMTIICVSCLLGLIIYLGSVASFSISPMTTGLRSAVSATHSSSILGGTQRAVTFDHLLVNIGEDFNPETGTFRCRLPGAYYFSFTVGKFPKKMLSIMLVKNGMEVGEVRAMVFNEDMSRRREMQSQSLLLSLKRGDSVWLYSQQDDGYAVYSNQGRYTTFSGFLVYPDGESMNRDRTYP